MLQQQVQDTGVPKGANYQITYVATVGATGRSASCTQYVCSIVKANTKRPPACKPFASSGIVRNATVCATP